MRVWSCVSELNARALGRGSVSAMSTSIGRRASISSSEGGSVSGEKRG